MGRKKGISTHRKNAKKKQTNKPVDRAASRKISTRRSNVRNNNVNCVEEISALNGKEFSTTNDDVHKIRHDEDSNELQGSKSIKHSNVCRSLSNWTQDNSKSVSRSGKTPFDEDTVTSPSQNDTKNNDIGFDATLIATPLENSRSNTIEMEQNDDGKSILNANPRASRKILVRNTINYGKRITHDNASDRSKSNRNSSTKVLISNTVNYNANDDSRTTHLSTPTNNVLVTNTINYNENSSISSRDSDLSSNDLSPNKENQFFSYSTRRRIIRKLKDSIKKVGGIYHQASILSEFLNETDMQPVLRAGNILSPKEVLANKHIVDQLLKQVQRCSQKNSTRGRINNDKDSLRTNLVAAMMCSPKDNNSALPIKKTDVLRKICSDTRISRSAGKRLINKAHKQRCILSSQEKITSWSIISQRHFYNTQQSNLNTCLFDWIINHPHVIPSPIARDTVLVKVPTNDGGFTKERVGKLLLEISVRELHQDLIRPPPIGFNGAFCKDTKKLLISERYLRNMLPPQLRAITFAQKQICGCECCTIMRMHHESLLKYRKAILNEQASSSRRATRNMSNKNVSFIEYQSEVMIGNDLKYASPRDMLPTMTCQSLSADNLPRWECVLSRCKDCPPPSIPKLELSSNNDLKKISYGAYKYHLKCKIHGPMLGNQNECEKCTLAISNNVQEFPEKITKRKEITLLELSIEHFHKNVYIPHLKKYKYHIALVTLLSKNHCKKMRCDAFDRNENWLLSERDYAERLVKELDGEIQSDHFGDNATLSIEGCILQYHVKHDCTEHVNEEKNIRMDFHSHFADFSKQDAATTFEHMCDMFERHIHLQGPFSKDCVFLDHTDGCAKQYRSGNALYLLNVLCLKYNIIIDRAVCAPGHGKSIIDGMNAVDKHYLKKVMCMSGSTRYDDIETRMSMFAMTENSTLSFAQECARLCSQSNRKYGVLNSEAYKKRKLKLSERFYYVQDPDKVRYSNLCKRTKGWKKQVHNQKGNGIQYHYNFRADPVLGLGYIAVRRIPCACHACIDQLNKPWKLKTSFNDQPRYMPNNQNCILWNVLGELNNWILISISDSDSSTNDMSSRTTKTIFKNCLQSRAESLISTIEKGNYAAVATNDENAVSGYYICCFRSCAYVLQENYVNKSEHIRKGELVCDITWLNSVPSCNNLYSHGKKDEKSLHTIIKVKHVVDENIKFHFLKSSNILPRQMRNSFQELQSLNTIVVDDNCHDNIVEAIQARNHLDYNDIFECSDDDIDESDSDNDE